MRGEWNVYGWMLDLRNAVLSATTITTSAASPWYAYDNSAQIVSAGLLLGNTEQLLRKGKAMDRLEAFEKMLCEIQAQAEYEAEQLDKLKAEGKEKTATFRQYMGNRMLYKTMLAKYREHGLID